MKRLRKKTRKKSAPPKNERTTTSAIAMPESMNDLLRRVAFSRAQKTGSRVSVSAVIRALVEESRDALEAEAKDL